MSPISRTGWGIPRPFTSDERTNLIKVLKKNEEASQAFLNDVEVAIVHYRADWSALHDITPESPSKTRDVLEAIAANAKTLHDSLDVLDFGGSYGLLLSAAGMMNYSVDAEKMMDELFWLQTAANKALRDWVDVHPGRPTDNVEIWFIAQVARAYKKRFGKLPPTSPESSFSVLVNELLKLISPGNPHICRDNSKIIKKALSTLEPPPARLT